MKVSEWLEAAADLVETRGWTRGQGVDDEDGGVCLVWSLREVTTEFFDESVALGLLADEVGIELSAAESQPVARGVSLELALMDWNDKGAQDAGQVIDVLRFAAKRARDAGDPEAAVEQGVSFPAEGVESY